jgi:hypothetical protein
MTDTLDRVVTNLANSALLEHHGFVLNADGRQAIDVLQQAFDAVARYFPNGDLTRQMDAASGYVDVTPAALYAVSLVVKANQQGIKAASLRGYLDCFDMVAKPEKLAGQTQLNRNLMLKAAHAIRTI